MRSAIASLSVSVFILSACGENSPPSGANSEPSTHSEFVGAWQAGGTFPGDCSDLVCPSQFSFRLQLRASGDCTLKGQTRAYRSAEATGEWSYEPWHPYMPTQGSCRWKTPDDWHIQLTLQNADQWSGALNGSVLEITSPAPEKLRVHFSRASS